MASDPLRARPTRRRFLKTSAAGAAAASLPACTMTAARAEAVQGSNEDLRVGVVGLRSRGRAHVRGLHRLPGVRVVGVCDADRVFLDRESEEFAKREETVETWQDYRDMLERGGLDAVAIATPNHWHSLMGIQAVEAGLDVYVEKPVSHNVWEGRQLVAAARKHGRIVACGTQSRSNPGLREAVAFVKEGHLGAVRLVRGLCYKRRPSIGKVASPTPIPATVDYDLWCGPAPKVPLMRKSLHYDWHWVWDTGNGDLGNQGIHQMDMARWILDENALPPEVISVGGRVGYDDDGETPNSQVILCAYDKAPLVFEVRGLPRASGQKEMDRFLGASIGVVAHCDDGYLVIDRYDGGAAYDAAGREIRKFRGAADHFANFVEAVQSRKPEDLNADIEEGHLSSALCHLGQVSHRLGKRMPAGELRDRVAWQPALAEAFWRLQEHLGGNAVDIAEAEQLTLGAPLQIDPATETCPGQPDAQRLLTRNYREPYVVPALA